jgi:hypothetical protein
VSVILLAASALRICTVLSGRWIRRRARERTRQDETRRDETDKIRLGGGCKIAEDKRRNKTTTKWMVAGGIVWRSEERRANELPGGTRAVMRCGTFAA